MRILNISMKPISIFVCIAALLGLSGCESPEQPSSISASEIDQLEAQLGDIKKFRPAVSSTAQHAAVSAFIETAEIEIGKAAIVERNSSAGENSHLENARDLLSALEQMIRPESNLPQLVVTQIAISSCEGCDLFYLTYAEFERGEREWKSYNFGMPMAPMTYRFRAAGDGIDYQEVVAVWQDPTTRTIQPRGGF